MAKVYLTKKHLDTLDVVNKMLTRLVTQGELKGEDKKAAVDYRNNMRDVIERHKVRMSKDY